MLEPYKGSQESVSRQPTQKMMAATTQDDLLMQSDIGPDDEDPPPDPEVFMQQYSFEYIHEKAKYMLGSLTRLIHQDVLDLELDDIAEDVSVLLWQKVQEKGTRYIQKPDAYIAQMLRYQYCDEIRSRKRLAYPQLWSTLEGETPLEHQVLLKPGAGMSDPDFEYEYKQNMAHLLHRVAYAVFKLPARQKLAMTCWLLERVDNLAWMTDALTIYGVNTDVRWPEDKKAKQRLQANLPAARQAIAKCLNIDISRYLQVKRHSRRSRTMD